MRYMRNTRWLRGRPLRSSLGLQAACLAVTLAAGMAPAGAAAQDRHFEVVTPPTKDFGFGSSGGADVAVASPDGKAVAYNAYGPLPGSRSGNIENYYRARREIDAWASVPVMPPANPVPGGPTVPQLAQTGGFSEDVSKALFLTIDPTLTTDALPGVPEYYLEDIDTGTYTLLTPGPVDPAAAFFTHFEGASKDFSHIVFGAFMSLLPGATAGNNTEAAYEWVNGGLRYVGVMPDGSAAESFSAAAARAQLADGEHAVSEDGRRIAFTAPTGGPLAVYVREDGVSTTLVSASQRTMPDPNGTQAARYWDASADGGKILFTSPEALTDDATTGEDGSSNLTDAGNDLYMYDLASGQLTDLSVDASPADLSTGANVLGVVGVSRDADYVYFVATGSLAGAAVPGSANLYAWHQGQIRYVATLASTDMAVWGLNSGIKIPKASRVSDDGKVMVFESSASLAGYDNTDANSGIPDSEIYRYTAGDDTLRCLSCQPDGGRPHGASTFKRMKLQGSQPRVLSDNGDRVFFDSQDDLVPQDTNGRADVYEYVGGSLQLVSTGTSRYDSFFQDASASGDDVFFSTRERLASQDQDDLVDLYDARVGPAPIVAGQDQCPATLCDGANAASGQDALRPGSIDLASGGNVAAARKAKATFSLRRISAAQRRQAAHTGRLTIEVVVSEAGTVKATAWAGQQKVGSAFRHQSHAGVLRLHVRLASHVRSVLRHHGSVRLRLVVTFSKTSAVKHATVSLHS